MAWVLFLRYYLIAKQNKKAMILSVNDPASSETVPSEPVPWMLLFRKAAFWYVSTHFVCNFLLDRILIFLCAKIKQVIWVKFEK